jgi:hypothetical protein
MPLRRLGNETDRTLWVREMPLSWLARPYMKDF